MNTSITPSDNFGGGKVKFFTGGSGGNDYYLVPLIFGSNQIRLTQDTQYFVTLNRNTFPINDASSDATISSFLRGQGQIFFHSYYATIQNDNGLTGLTINLAVKIYIDNIRVYTEQYVLDDNNSYTEQILINVTDLGLNLNHFPIENNFSVKYEFSGDIDPDYSFYLYNSSNGFTSLIDENSSYKSVLSSSFVTSSVVLNNSLGSNFYYLSFGGCNFLANNSNPLQTFCANFNGTITGIYWMVNEFSSISLNASEEISLYLLKNGAVVEEIITSNASLSPYDPIVLNCEVPIIVGDSIILKITGTNLTNSYYIAEVGCLLSIIQ